MRTAIDSSVLLDVLGGDVAFGRRSQEALRQVYDAGSLVACEVVWAEVRAHFPADAPFEDAMKSLGVDFVPLASASAALAGQLWRKHRTGASAARKATPAPRRLVADFLVGAHALRHADQLLTRDRGFYRAYFKGLRVVEP